MRGAVQSIWRHPVKGFTPEALASATLAEGGYFPCDRLYAVEDGPSGFDPAAPGFISKQKFTVLAKIAEVAWVRTAYDEASGVLQVEAADHPGIRADLTDAAGRDAFAAWLTGFLGDLAIGPLKVVQAPGHRFMDHPKGFVSLINLASLRDLETRIGRPVDPLRFRANLYVEGWPAWSEEAMVGASLRLGEAVARIDRPIVRCVATHVDPATGERDIDMVRALFDHRGAPNCGVYLSVTEGGLVTIGGPAEIEA
jgi:uncharacterized protein YcbX